MNKEQKGVKIGNKGRRVKENKGTCEQKSKFRNSFLLSGRGRREENVRKRGMDG